MELAKRTDLAADPVLVSSSRATGTCHRLSSLHTSIYDSPISKRLKITWILIRRTYNGPIYGEKSGAASVYIRFKLAGPGKAHQASGHVTAMSVCFQGASFPPVVSIQNDLSAHIFTFRGDHPVSKISFNQCNLIS
jgi:hypothetical protein